MTMLDGILCVCFHPTLTVAWWDGCCGVPISQAGNRLGKVKGLNEGHAGSEWWSPDSKLVLT